MLEPEVLADLRQAIGRRTRADRGLLEALRAQVRDLSSGVRSIKPRTSTAISLVASDGGNNQLIFDPFFIQVVQVVDSYGKQLCIDAVSPTTDTGELSRAQFGSNGEPRTALGVMMRDLGVDTLAALSPMIPSAVRSTAGVESARWTIAYRDLCEWAALYERICHHTFATDTVFLRDGLLRSNLFREGLFVKLRGLIEASIATIRSRDRRSVFVAGIAKQSKVLSRYSLAMALENTLPPGEPRYVRIPRSMEAESYVWEEWTRGRGREDEREPKFALADMYFARFGNRRGDPIWVIDILSSQSHQAAEILGHLYADAVNGFPVPYYPLCLQRAHEHAQVAEFDLAILQDVVIEAIRSELPQTSHDVLDAIQFGLDAGRRRFQ